MGVGPLVRCRRGRSRLCRPLEDFEREVNLLSFADKSQVKQNVIKRHLQFISAIREQTRLVEQSMSTSLGNSLTNMHLSEQDRDGLAIFLSGRNNIKHIADEEREDSNILRRFLDPAVLSSSREDNDGEKSGETISFLDHDLELKEIYRTRLYSGSSSSVQEANYGRYDEEGNWDLRPRPRRFHDRLGYIQRPRHPNERWD